MVIYVWTMSQKITAITTVLAISIFILTIVATTTPLAYAQIVIGPPRDIDPEVDTELEQNTVCSGWSYACG
jgi:hypothetical protein